MSKNQKIYKGRYCIGIYGSGSDDQLIGLFDNVQELAEYLETSLATAKAMVSQSLKGTKKKVVLSGSLVSLTLIDMRES